MSTKERLDGHDLVELWQRQNKAWHFEGETGLDNLNKLAEDLRYAEERFKYGEPLMLFLADNPGACDVLVEFIAENASDGPFWDALTDATGGDNEDDVEVCDECGHEVDSPACQRIPHSETDTKNGKE